MNAPVAIHEVALRNLSRTAYGNGWTLWHYRADRLSDVLWPGFWADATMLKQGDHIAVSAEDGGATLYVGRAGVVVMAAVSEWRAPTLPTIPHATAERLRDMIASCQMSVFLASDVPDAAKERIVNEISVFGFRLIDELEGVVR